MASKWKKKGKAPPPPGVVDRVGAPTDKRGTDKSRTSTTSGGQGGYEHDEEEAQSPTGRRSWTPPGGHLLLPGSARRRVRPPCTRSDTRALGFIHLLITIQPSCMAMHSETLAMMHSFDVMHDCAVDCPVLIPAPCATTDVHLQQQFWQHV
jgi:hypothetical protein